MIDSRMCMLSLLTPTIPKYHAGLQAADIANHVEFKDFVKDENGKITGAVLHDKINDDTFSVKSKVVVNCAGLKAD